VVETRKQERNAAGIIIPAVAGSQDDGVKHEDGRGESPVCRTGGDRVDFCVVSAAADRNARGYR